MSRKSLFTLLVASALMAAQSDNFYQYGERKRYSMDGNRRFSDKIPKAVDSRQLREFSIKGNKIMAYSKKDAITRLKHLKKL
jgi:hypothetical protein